MSRALPASRPELLNEALGPGGPIFSDADDPDFGTDTGDTEDIGNGCVGQTAGTEAVPAVLQLVVDTSGSE